MVGNGGKGRGRGAATAQGWRNYNLKKYKELIVAINDTTTDGAEDMHSRFYPVAIPRSTSQTIREAFQAVLNMGLRFRLKC